MATAKRKPTVAIVNPWDPKDPAPLIANQDDVTRNGWQLWADRHDPDFVAKVEAAEAEKGDGDEKTTDDPKPAEGGEQKPAEGDKGDEDKAEVKDGSAAKPEDVKKAPAKK